MAEVTDPLRGGGGEVTGFEECLNFFFRKVKFLERLPPPPSLVQRHSQDSLPGDLALTILRRGPAAV